MTDEYLESIADYYNNSRLPSTPGAAAAFRHDMARDGHWAKPIVADMQAALAGRRVLEMACGGGRWTQFAADVAKNVTATDISENLLDNARGLCLGNVDFIQCDAFRLDQTPRKCDAGLHMNFINHLPLAQAARFLDHFHGVLGPGAVVFCGAQRFRGNATEPVYEHADSGDTVSLRRHDDGRAIEIVDTLFTEDLLKGLLAGRGTSLQFSANSCWWWLEYRVL